MTGQAYLAADKGRLIPIAQCNNVFDFLVVGRAIASGARRVTDGMRLAAARALGDNFPARKNLVR